MASRVSFGMKYDNFESLENDLKLFEKEAFVNLRRHDTHLLATSKSKGKCMHYKDELVYKNITYICKHGGVYKSHKVVTGERPNQATNKKDCQFRLRFAITKDGQALECVKFISGHNHQISQQTFNFDYSQRKLEKTDQLEVANLLKMGPNRKLVKKNIMRKKQAKN